MGGFRVGAAAQEKIALPSHALEGVVTGRSLSPHHPNSAADCHAVHCVPTANHCVPLCTVAPSRCFPVRERERDREGIVTGRSLSLHHPNSPADCHAVHCAPLSAVAPPRCFPVQGTSTPATSSTTCGSERPIRAWRIPCSTPCAYCPKRSPGRQEIWPVGPSSTS